MFLVNRIFGSSSTAAIELATLEGSLYLVRPNSIKGSRECIMIDACLSIRRKEERDYELVVTKTWQEGEEQLLEEDAENVDERAFELCEDLFLCFGKSLDQSSDSIQYSFTWAYQLGDASDDEFEFVLSSKMEFGIEFEKLAWRCLWENQNDQDFPKGKNEAAAVEATLAELYQTYRVDEVVKDKKPLFRAVSVEPDSSDDEAPPLRRALPVADSDEGSDTDNDSGAELAAALMSKATISKEAPKLGKPIPAQSNAIASTSANKIVPPKAAPAPPKVVAPRELAPPIIRVEGRLYLYDLGVDQFVQQDPAIELRIQMVKNSYWIVVEGKNGPWISQSIESEMSLNFASKEMSMAFNYTHEETGQTFTWVVRFADAETFEAVQSTVAKALFEEKNGVGGWAKLKGVDREYQQSAYLEDTIMLEGEVYSEEEEEEEEYEEDESEEEFEEQGDSGDDDEEVRQRSFKAKKKEKNSQLAVGYKDAMSFVVAGDMIGVFKQSRDGEKKLDFVTNMIDLKTPDGKKLAPSKLMLHNQDSTMILQNPNAAGQLYKLDLETGKIVEEFVVSDNFAVTSFLPTSKFAQTTQEATFVGLSSNGVFKIDPRLRGNKLVDSEFKQYVSKNDFSAAATTEKGLLAVASNKGDIRLFDKLGKNAKTALPALGDAIIGIDVTADGRWVLATCKTYLLLIDTKIPDDAGRYGGSSGFERSFPADMKPVPKRLQLRPEHVAQMELDSTLGVSFKPAKFNSGPGVLEKTIVTATGSFLIAWNFRKVKAGDTTGYTMRRYSEEVVADNFKFGNEREIIVTLPDNVFMQGAAQLAPPSRKSMSVVKEWNDR